MREAVDEALAEPSAGVARVDVDGRVALEAAWGLADRRLEVAMQPCHRIAVASGSKGFTALAVMSLIAQGRLALGTTARSVLGADLPLVAADVTVEHLLSHRSGVGEYLDDDADLAEYLLPGAMSGYVSPEDYLGVLDGREPAFPAGSGFAYCNSGFILLALIAQRASGTPFHDLVRTRVLEPAGMARTDYLRSDALPGDAAIGYIEVDGVWRTTVHHLPVIGGGDGGVYTTAEDMHRFWSALLAGRIVPIQAVREMCRVRSSAEETGEGAGYGLGLWLPAPGVVRLEGMDAGSSFVSTHTISSARTVSVLSTTAHGAWDIAEVLESVTG
ncbi:CubicO group peptidase (beta-lactamase class C family) [Serinibacter salmoneus]|uniref:CubicO group peptidase (Beta-lactamase class C family) n=1 Tax=Serinibacter salmoneus TaxID=556530 RepID=A0A2A9CXU1_9MICO|nr:CubicO group peptidase (beta-lactamase class C family) [Serinibacter salmoneus]